MRLPEGQGRPGPREIWDGTRSASGWLWWAWWRCCGKQQLGEYL